MADNSILTVQNLSVGYKSVVIIDDISFDIAQGRVVGLAGLNGQGKTTLIKTIIGLMRPQSGHVVLHRRSENISYLPERFTPPALLTGLEFVNFSLQLLKQKISNEELLEAACRFSLNQSIMNKKISTYSKGMKQKIGLLATFLADVPLIVLDEPMSGLDPLGRQQVKEFIKKARKKGQSVFMTSHVLFDFLELCDDILVFHDKKSRFLGAPKELLKVTGESSIENAFLERLK